ncbi:MAG: hypothetical protein JNG90_05365 [Planctomycetaceae bacterium]|nr:hypothetical protein [Planctomycetaceae bacterium]
MLRPANQPEHGRPHAGMLRAGVLEAYLLGTVEYNACLALQQRLAFEARGATEPRIALLLCEHPPVVTVGREGSRRQILFSREELLSHRLDVQWVARGGGCLVHAPGQLAVYPLAPLEQFGWSVGAYLERFQQGLGEALAGFRMTLAHTPGRPGIWGRSGQLVSLGVAVRNWVSLHGAWINVAPPMDLVRKVLDPVSGTPLSSLAVERQQVVKMTDLRTRLVPALAAAFDCQRWHIYTGHPWLRASGYRPARGARRVG